MIECPACGVRLRVPHGDESRRLQCPKCLEIIAAGRLLESAETIDAPLGDAEPRAFVHALPAGRNLEEQVIRIRGREKEEWERQGTELKTPEFDAHVARIGEDVADDVEHIRVKKRRKPLEMDVPGWEKDLRRRHRRTAGRIRQLIWGSVALGLLGVVLVAIWALKTAIEPASPTPPGDLPPPAFGVPALTNAGDAAEGVIDFPTVGEADFEASTQVMRTFFAAQAPVDMLPVIRDRERVRPMIDAYYRAHPFQPPIVRRLPLRGDLFAYKSVVLGTVSLDDFEDHIVAVEKTPAGYFVDWESYVGWCEVPWDDLAKVKPLRPVLLRAHVKSDDYFNRGYADSLRFACFRLSTLRGDQHVYGYVERSTALFTQLQSRTRLNPVVLAVVKVRYLTKSVPDDQVEITELVEDGWVLQHEQAKAAASRRQ
jgi:hypothetical protein